MQLTMSNSKNSVKLRDIAVTVPKSLCSGKIFNQESSFDKYCFQEVTGEIELTQMVSRQHPLIMTWLVFSLVSIGILFPLLFSIN